MGKGEKVKRGVWPTLLRSLSPLLLCSLSLLLCALPAAAQTSALPVNVVLMLPNTWSGETFSGMVFHPTNQGRTLLLWPSTASGTTIVNQVAGAVTNLNGSTNASQTLVVGTSGADFNIASGAGVHTFHLPTASATVRGALSSADWSTFNAKSNHLVQTNGVNLGSAGTVNWTTGVTGHLASGVANVGVSVTSGSGTPGGEVAQVQVHGTGGTFVGSTGMVYHVTNQILYLKQTGAGYALIQIADIAAPNATNELGPQWVRQMGAHNLGIGNHGSNNWLFTAEGHFRPNSSNVHHIGTWDYSVGSNVVEDAYIRRTFTLASGSGAGRVLTDVAGTGVGTWAAPAGAGVASGGFVSGITNYGYSTTNVLIDLGATNYAVHCITNTGGPVNLQFTNLTLGFNWTVLIDGVDLDGTTSATNALVTYVWPHANDVAQWLGFTTNTYVTSNKVLGITGFIRRTNSIILSSRE